MLIKGFNRMSWAQVSELEEWNKIKTLGSNNDTEKISWC